MTNYKLNNNRYYFGEIYWQFADCLEQEMRSWIVRVCQTASGAKAEAKLLLAGIAHHYRQAAFPGTDSSVASALGLSRASAATLIAKLAHAKLLVNEPAVTGRRGRPAACYRIHSDVWAKWLKAAEGSDSGSHRDEGGHFEGVIQRLLQGPAAWSGERPTGQGEPPSRQGAAGRLSPSNRLLLMVLLGIADRNGVVREWGPSALSRLVGLTPGRLEGQLQKLLALGYLRAVVPGVSGHSLFGKRPGALFLNLSHPSYKGLLPEIVLVYPVEELELTHRSQGDAMVIYRQLQQMKRQDPSGYVWTLFSNAGFADPQRAMKRLAVNFDGIGTSTLPVYFQMRLEMFATRLMSSSQPQGDDLLMSQLRETMALDAFKKSFKDLKGGQLMYITLVEFLARRQADLMRRAIDRISCLAGQPEVALSLKGASYALIPAISTSNGHYVVICAMPAFGEAAKAVCIIMSEKSGKVILAKEENLPKEKMFEYGLLTRKSKKPSEIKSLEVKEHLWSLLEPDKIK